MNEEPYYPYYPEEPEVVYIGDDYIGYIDNTNYRPY